jgi:hypothetical protein
MDNNLDEPNDRIAWHPAFRSAIRLEFEDYQDVLEFKFENELNDEPLRVDTVIVKKLKDVPIKKNIAAIFRSNNIFEFKSPTDFFSVGDFYKVYGYACLYLSLNKLAITDITITVVVMQEVLRMSNAGEITYEELLREVGFIDRWEAIGEARGKEEKAFEIAGNLLAEGFSVEQTAKLAGLDMEKVRTLTVSS